MKWLDKILFVWLARCPPVMNYTPEFVMFKSRINSDETITVDVFYKGEPLFNFDAVDGRHASRDSHLSDWYAEYQLFRRQNAIIAA